MTGTAGMPGRVLGVGFLGAGPVTQAIHLPTLARLTDRFRVARVMDVDPQVAESVASRVGASWTTQLDELMGDPAVDVVAVCSPHPFHAAQVSAACRAGKRVVFCEKPFAASVGDAAEVAAVARETGVPIVVGAMHAYDAGWVAAAQGSPVRPQSIRSSIVLPPNPRFEDFATEVVNRAAPFSGGADDAEAAARAVSGGILGLAIHDLPLIRQLLGRVDDDAWRDVRVLHARAGRPFGYLVILEIGGCLVELHAAMSGNWAPSWHLAAFDGQNALDVEFTPSYVQAGSATAALSTAAEETRVRPAAHNGYESEWLEIARIAEGGTPRIPVDALIDDLGFALDIADKAAAFIRAGAAERVPA